MHRGLAAPVYDFALGIGDELVSYTVKKPRKSPTRYYTHSNSLFSIAATTNASGQVVEKYSYNAYGVQTVRNSANAVISKSAVGQDRGFTSYKLDSEHGNYYARARMYSAKYGRFVSRDSFGYFSGYNLYAGYFSPNGVDPWGYYTITPNCCRGIQSQIRGAEKSIEFINSQIVKKQYSLAAYKQEERASGFSVIGLSGIGVVGKGLDLPPCYQEAVNTVEKNGWINTGRRTIVWGLAPAIGIISTVGNFSGKQGSADFMTLYMLQELVAQKAYLHELQVIGMNCEKEEWYPKKKKKKKGPGSDDKPKTPCEEEDWTGYDDNDRNNSTQDPSPSDYDNPVRGTPNDPSGPVMSIIGLDSL